MTDDETYGNEEPLFEDWSLEILCNMTDPPGEAFEASYLRARELLEEAGPNAGILLLTVTADGDDLASSVVLSGGYQRIRTDYLLEILDAHLGALTEE